MKEINTVTPVFHGTANLFLLVRQKLHSSQPLMIEEINKVCNWVSHSIPFLQEGCRVSERPSKFNYCIFFSDLVLLPQSWLINSWKNEALLTSVNLEVLVQLLGSLAPSLHKDYIFGSLFSIKYLHIFLPSTFPNSSFGPSGLSSECLTSVIYTRVEMGKWEGFNTAYRLGVKH